MDREAQVHQAIVDALASVDDDRTPLDLVEEIPLLEASMEAVIADRVEAARAQGLSWEAIALRLGISRQAAHKRFGKARRRKPKTARQRVRVELRVEREGGERRRT